MKTKGNILSFNVNISVKSLDYIDIKKASDSLRKSLSIFGTEVCDIYLCDEKDDTIDNKLEHILEFINVPYFFKGYNYLKASVIACVENKKLICSITKKLYPRIAEEFSTTPYAIEGSIRKLVKNIWENDEKREKMKLLFGNIKEKPSNSEFIYMFVKNLKK